MPFLFPQKVLFRHCDPAGIVFFPRYFEMINDTVEAFFDTCLGHPFEVLHQTGAVPTAQIETTFTAPSRHGDDLQIALRCTRIGGASLGLAFEGSCGSETRFVASSTLVHVNETGRPEGWSPGLCRAIEEFMEGDN